MRKDSTSVTEAKALTVAQESAVDLLVAGKNDTETAATLSLHRATVTRWRLYSPEFQAALAERRAAVWGSAADRLRSLMPKALDRIAEALDGTDAAARTAAAFNILRLACPLPLVPSEPVSADEIVRRKVEAERDHLRSRSHDFNLADVLSYGLPNFDDHLASMGARLDYLAGSDVVVTSDSELVAEAESKPLSQPSTRP
jgi:hypothetical protein